MKDIPLTDVIQYAYDKASEAIRTGELAFKSNQDVYHIAYSCALFDLYNRHAIPDKKHHYDLPIKKLKQLFKSGKVKQTNTYAAFAYCYLKVFLREKVIKKKTFQAQFEYENNKHA
ncbi:hypothetical protein MNBD_GAMMA07-398 [hydrothermal vent metagenome]|uniref:Uncharacterized protein n=1 Tax=hydrothermal vent metagenome TaxID=652676 RepID=A0A3B0WMF0_9ZZZZ